MPKQRSQTVSLTEQILDVLFHGLESRDGIDADVLLRLHVLAEHGGMSKASKIAEILKSTPEASDETH